MNKKSISKVSKILTEDVDIDFTPSKEESPDSTMQKILGEFYAGKKFTSSETSRINSVTEILSGDIGLPYVPKNKNNPKTNQVSRVLNESDDYYTDPKQLENSCFIIIYGNSNSGYSSVPHTFKWYDTAINYLAKFKLNGKVVSGTKNGSNVYLINPVKLPNGFEVRSFPVSEFHGYSCL